MKTPIYDYSGFSLKRLNEPRFSHLKLLGGWIVYFALYFITENLIPQTSCHVIHCALDDRIPFNEFFAVFYVGWYFFVAGALLYTGLHNIEGFRRVQIFIIVTQLLAMLCYIVYPSVQLLRPQEFARHNVFTWILGLIYAFDTPTGVCPSLHVAYSIGIASAALKDKALPRVWKAGAVFFTVMVCLAVCFVKQHSVLDVLAALPVCAVAEVVVRLTTGKGKNEHRG